MKKATFSGSSITAQWVLQSKANYNIYKPLKNSSLIHQHALIRLVLSHDKTITVEWARKHGIDYLPARVKELKNAGVPIGTHYASDFDENGTRHKKRAFYYLDKTAHNDIQLTLNF